MARTLSDLFSPVANFISNTFSSGKNAVGAVSSSPNVVVDNFHSEIVSIFWFCLFLFVIFFGFFVGVVFSHNKNKNPTRWFWSFSYFFSCLSIISLAVYYYVYLENFFAIVASIYSVIFLLSMIVGRTINNYAEGYRLHNKITNYNSFKTFIILLLFIVSIFAYSTYKQIRVMEFDIPLPAIKSQKGK